MKICFVGPANSSHIVKWCKWFSNHGHIIHVVSFTPGAIQGAEVHLVDIGVDTNGSDFSKLKYLFAFQKIQKIISEIKPDIINVHYASSYGAVMALSGIKKYVLSVWGSDIYDFPSKSLFHKALLKYSLHRASAIFSTSKAMAEETRKYTNKKIEITPFGVDLELFSPKKRIRAKDDDFVVGTIKGLSDKYGIRLILEAVAFIYARGDIPIKLRIAGKGPQEKEYHILAQKLGINDITTWLGFISQEQAAIEWANMDVAVIPSTLESESFGVSAVEAQACGVPVIISNIPGLMEATIPEKSSIVVNRNDSKAIASAIRELFGNASLRTNLCEAGLKHVTENYEINKCFEHIENLFVQINNED